MKRSILLALVLAVVAAAMAAEPCAHRGKLDALYCDENRDLVADPPKDPAKLVSPDPLIFTYAPVEDPAVYEGAWSDFLKHLEKVTGKKTKYFGLQNAKNDKIKTIADLKGKRVAHVSQTSSSGHQAPIYFFSRMGVTPGKDYQIVFSGKHDASALGVVNGDYDAAAVADTVLERMVARGVVKAGDYKVIYTSPVFPTAGFLYPHNLEPKLVEKIKDAFASFKFAGTSVGKEFKDRTGFLPLNYQKDWESIVGILEANGVTFTKDSPEYKRLEKRGSE